MNLALNTIPGLRAVVQDPSQQGFASSRGFPIEFSLSGADWQQFLAVEPDLSLQIDQAVWQKQAAQLLFERARLPT